MEARKELGESFVNTWEKTHSSQEKNKIPNTVVFRLWQKRGTGHQATCVGVLALAAGSGWRKNVTNIAISGSACTLCLA
jgi:hypothetical protein